MVLAKLHLLQILEIDLKIVRLDLKLVKSFCLIIDPLMLDLDEHLPNICYLLCLFKLQNLAVLELSTFEVLWIIINLL